MRGLISLCLLALLNGCVSTPPRNPAEAWIEVYSASYESLMADTLDGATWGPGSYYQVAPGTHTLGLNFNYGPRFCTFSLAYGDFQAGRSYHLLAGWGYTGGWVHLLDEQGQTLASQTCDSPYGK